MARFDINQATQNVQSAYNASQASGNTSNYFERLFDPQGSAEKFNAYQAQLNRDFQASQVLRAQAYDERMRNTAYQAAVKDMREAGLNPALMYGSGSAASSPHSPIASGGSAHSSGNSPLIGLLNSAVSLATTVLGARSAKLRHIVEADRLALSAQEFDWRKRHPRRY